MFGITGLEEEKQIRAALQEELKQRISQLDDETARAFAADCASRVLFMYAERYPDDGRAGAITSAARLIAKGLIRPEIIAGEVAFLAQAVESTHENAATARQNYERTSAGGEMAHMHRMIAAEHAALSAMACVASDAREAAESSCEYAAFARSNTVGHAHAVGDGEGVAIEHSRATEEHAWQLKRLKELTGQ